MSTLELLAAGVRPVERAVTQIGERRERAQRPFPDLEGEHDSDPGKDDAKERSTPARREPLHAPAERRRIDLHVSGQLLPTRHPAYAASVLHRSLHRSV